LENTTEEWVWSSEDNSLGQDIFLHANFELYVDDVTLTQPDKSDLKAKAKKLIEKLDKRDL